MKIAVVGANGQLGRPVSTVLRERGHQVCELGRRHWRASPAGDQHRGHIDPRGVRRAVHECGPDVIVNLAASGVVPNESTGLWETNALLPVLLSTAADGVPLVHLGSSAEYGDHPDLSRLSESTPALPMTNYGQSKLVGTAGALAASVEHQGRVVVLRLFGAYGEDERPHRLLPSLFRELRAGRAVELSDGLQVRDLLYQRDVAAAVADAAERVIRCPSPTRPSGVLNLGSGHPVTVRDFCLAAADRIGADRGLLKFGRVPRRATDVDRCVADVRAIGAALLWRSTFTLELGIDSAVSALERNHG